MIKFNRTTYFDTVRESPFGGSLSQEQVDGQNTILGFWEKGPGVLGTDLRWLAYELATTKHETASTMLPIEEYGKGAGQPYGVQDPETKQTYYGRGFVQLTWRENYARATLELGLVGENDLELHADRALDPVIAAQVMHQGMVEGWFRKGQTLERYFNKTVNDPYNAREIINGDKSRIPEWSNGVSIGRLISNYHDLFLSALEEAAATPTTNPLIV